MLNREIGEELLIPLFDCHLRSEVGRHCLGTNSVWLQHPDFKAFVLSRGCGLSTCRNPDSTRRKCVERLGVRLLRCGLPRTRGLTPFVAVGWGECGASKFWTGQWLRSRSVSAACVSLIIFLLTDGLESRHAQAALNKRCTQSASHGCLLVRNACCRARPACPRCCRHNWERFLVGAGTLVTTRFAHRVMSGLKGCGGVVGVAAALRRRATGPISLPDQ